MSGWIKWEKSIESDPRVLRMARKVERRFMLFDCDVTQEYDPCNACAFPAVTLVCGALVRMWSYADTHIRDDDVLDLGPDELDLVVGLPGFAALCPQDWLELIDDEHVKLPNYQAHNGTEAKRKALTQKRVETHRKRKVVTACNGSALPDQDQTKTRPRPDQKKEVPTEPTGGLPPAPPDEFETRFEEFRSLYPKRSGDQRWQTAQRAIRARLREGHTWDEILDGARRYAAWVRHTGKERTETVKQAATFVGTDKAFREPFDMPATKADIRLASNLTAAEEFKRRTAQ